MRRAVLAVILGACGFPTTSGSEAAPGVGAATSDAAITTDAPASEVAPSEFCAPTTGTAVSHVRACFEFDDSADDGSSHHLRAHASGLTFVAGEAGKALSFGANSDADFDDSPVFDATSLTIEMWINPPAMPSSTVNLLDVNNQYAFQLKADGDLHCTLIGGKSLDADTNIQAGVWTHVACTYDELTGKAVIYANGSEVNSDSTSKNRPLATNGTDGLSLAADNPPPADTNAARARMVGLVDQVRLLDYARSAAELCADSGRQTCQ